MAPPPLLSITIITILLVVSLFPAAHLSSADNTNTNTNTNHRRFLHQPLFPDTQSHNDSNNNNNNNKKHYYHSSPAPSPQPIPNNLTSATDSSTSTSPTTTNTASDSAFFPSYQAPPPPSPQTPSSYTTALPTFPANISSLVVPHTPGGSSSSSRGASHKLVVISIVLCILAASLLASIVFLHRRHRHRHRGPFKPDVADDESLPSDDVRLYPPNIAASDSDTNSLPDTKPNTKPFRSNPSNTSTEFLYLGTVANNVNYSRNTNTLDTRLELESPEIRPLPPLPRQTLRLISPTPDADAAAAGARLEGGISSSSFSSDDDNHHNVEEEEDEEAEAEMFYSPVGSLRRATSTSARAIEVLERDIFSDNNNNNNNNKVISYYSSSNSSPQASNAPCYPEENLVNSPELSSPSPPMLTVPLPTRGAVVEEEEEGSIFRRRAGLGRSVRFRVEETDSFSVESDGAEEEVVGPPPPPPPPPPPQSTETAVGPPPLPRPWRSFSSGEQPRERARISGEITTTKPKLKGLHWDKFRASSDRAMVWDHLKPASFPLNEELIETLFTANGPQSLAAKDPARRSVMPPFLDSEYRVLDPKKSQNIAILLRAVNVTVEDVRNALIEGNGEVLGTQLLETLLKMAPTKDEELRLRNYKDESPLKLGPAEKFLKEIIDIPFAFKRVEAMLYMANFDSEAEYLRKSFDTLETACEELKNSRMFLKLLEAVLNTGNRMNSGTNRGDAQAFKLDTLLKLVDIKGTDGKTTLLHFVVHEIIKSDGCCVSLAEEQKADDLTVETSRRPSLQDDIESRKRGLEVVASLGGELVNVRKAAGMDCRTLCTDAANLAGGLLRVDEVAKMSEEAGWSGKDIINRSFGETLNAFLKNAGQEIATIRAKERCAVSKVKEVTEYFHGNSDEEEAHPLRIFVVVRDFLSILDRVCKEVGKSIERNVISYSSHQLLTKPVAPL